MHQSLHVASRALLAAVVLILSGVGPSAIAQTLTVDITEDIVDIDPATATDVDLPGPDGHVSFSEAMIASNNTPGHQTVAFNIPESEWTYLPWFYPGRAVLNGIMFDAVAYDEVTIDGTTQTDFTGDTNPDGWEVVILRGGSVYLPADNCTVTGLDYTSLYLEGSNSVVENNSVMGIEVYGGLGGGGNLIQSNVGGGWIKIVQSNDNIVLGNTVSNVRVIGWLDGGQAAMNNVIGGPNLADRNHITGTGSITGDGFPGGYGIQLYNAIGTIIENNWIGMTEDGLGQGNPYTTMGIWFDTENYDTNILGNRIAGVLAWVLPTHGGSYQTGAAIELHGEGSGVTILGNTIGLNANEEPLGSVTGIASVHFFYPVGIQEVTIGGTVPGEGNVIAGHLGAGISVANSYSGVRISGNSIHDNGGLGIDLITSLFEIGVSPNDPLDVDVGGNGVQNFPEVRSALTNGLELAVSGALDSLPSADFTLEFFASAVCDVSGYGQGAEYLGSTTVTTDAAGLAAFSVTLPVVVDVGAAVTATAINATDDTSEFSACVSVAFGEPPVAVAAGTPTSGSAPLTVQFSSVGSTDPDGTIVSYAWSFGDGGSSVEASPSHTYVEPGEFSATLTVTDDSGSSRTSDAILVVVAAVDQDADGYFVGADCDDTDPTVHPGAIDLWYDGVDQDCDGASDFDQDGDGDDRAGDGGADCDDTDPARSSLHAEVWYDGVDQNCDGKSDFDKDHDTFDVPVDCDDDQLAIQPGAVEIWYDGVDQNCDGASDFDQDGDGFVLAADCDDTRAAVHPGAADTWYDGIDGNCDGANDFDQDADGYPFPADCDDLDAAVYPGAPEIWYNFLDEACDEGDDFDQDGDGVRAILGDDCDDTDATVFPGASDAWYDGADSDCDGADDYDQDADGDPIPTDCDDLDPASNSLAAEVWYDGVDQACDGGDDFDQDGDGDPTPADCADTDPTRSSLAAEVWYDGVDQDCAGGDDFDQDGDGVVQADDCDDLDPAVSMCDGPGPEPDLAAGCGGCATGGLGGAWAALALAGLVTRRRR